MNRNKITTCIWFNDNNGAISKVIEYYKHIFGTNFRAGEIISLGETPSGYSEMCEITLFDCKYTFMNTAIQHHALNDAISFIINCKDQNEVDTYWDYFTKDGDESECGWCHDRYRLSWQIIPINLGELIAQPGGWEVMLSQKKIVIEDYFK